MTETIAPLALAQKLYLHREFWRGKLRRPMLGVFHPVKFPSPPPPGERRCPFDFARSAAEIVERSRRAWARPPAGVDDRISAALVDFGVAFLTALAGGKFEYDHWTCWSVPIASSVTQLRLKPFCADDPLWADYLAKLRALRDAEIPNIAIGLPDMTGPLDMLSGLVGGQQLCMDMMTEPGAVADALAACLEIWQGVYRAHERELGLQHGGTFNRFNLFTPGRGALWSEDFTALMSPGLYERFGQKIDHAIAAGFDCTFMHVHSAAGACLPLIAEIEPLSGIEISNDPNGPPIEKLLEWGRLVQAKGKSLIMSNWNRPLEDDTIRRILGSLDTSRLLITLQCTSPDQAEHYARLVREYAR